MPRGDHPHEGGLPLAAPNVCTKCGFANQPSYQFCTNCGNPLVPPTGAPPPGPTTAYYPPPAYYGAPPWEYETRRRIDRTKTGVLLLLIGTLISWIPIVAVVGYVLLFIGAILVILGRKAFGRVHARNVVVSIVLFVLGLVGTLAAAIPFGVAVATIQLQGVRPDSAAQLESSLQILLVGGAVTSFVLGLASVLFTYALQNPTGRLLLWSGYGASVALSLAVAWILSPLVPGAVQEALAGGVLDMAPLVALQAEESRLGLLGVLPALLFASATYIAWSRIHRGEIPVREMPPAAPAAMPPPPPS